MQNKRHFNELTDKEILRLALIANRNDIANPINETDWKIERELDSIYVRFLPNAANKLWFSVSFGGFGASLLLPDNSAVSLGVPFHEFLDYLESINVDFRNV